MSSFHLTLRDDGDETTNAEAIAGFLALAMQPRVSTTPEPVDVAGPRAFAATGTALVQQYGGAYHLGGRDDITMTRVAEREWRVAARFGQQSYMAALEVVVRRAMADRLVVDRGH